MRRAGAALAVSAAMVAAPLAAAAETLADAMIAAYRHSGLLEQNRALLRAADEDVAVATAALRPIISYSLSTTFSDPGTPTPSGGTDNLSTMATISGSLMLYDFGRTRDAIEAAKETVLATRQSLRAIEQQVLLRAVTAYMAVRRDAEFVELRRRNERLIIQELRAAKDRFEVGEGTRTDVAIAEARLAAARSALAAAQGAYAMSKEEFKAAVGRYPGALSPPPRLPRAASSLDKAKAIARARHPDILRVQHEVSASELTVTRAKKAMKPSVNASSALNLNEDGYSSSSVTLSLSGPIYQGGQLTALYRQAAARRDAIRAGLHVTTHAVLQGVGNSWANVQVARASLEASERQIRASTVAFRGVQEERRLGARTTLDVLNSEQELLDARTSRTAAVADQYIATYALLASMGLLTAEHLKLGIPLYDPAAYYDAVKDAPTRKVSPQGEKLDRVLKSLGKY